MIGGRPACGSVWEHEKTVAGSRSSSMQMQHSMTAWPPAASAGAASAGGADAEADSVTTGVPSVGSAVSEIKLD